MKLSSVFNYAQIYDETDYLSNVMTEKKFVSPVEVPVQNVFVGIEVEVERVLRGNGILTLPTHRYLWGCKEDGSLRNNGREFVSVPIRGDSIPFALNMLHSTLNREKNCIGHEFSERTSVHVHVNVQDFTSEQLANLLLVYLLIEPLIYNYTGTSRYKNIFCVPLNQTNQVDTLRGFIEAVEKDSEEYVRHYLRNWHKYTGFNMQPVSSFGTVEFRHMYGTSNVKVLSNWINILLRLHQYAKKQDYTKLKTRLFAMNTSSEYMQVVYEIFGDDVSLVLEEKLQQHMEEMVIFIKDIFVDVPLKKLISKEISLAFKENAKAFPLYFNALKYGWIKEIVPPKYSLQQLVGFLKDKDLAIAVFEYGRKYEVDFQNEQEIKQVAQYLTEDSKLAKRLLNERKEQPVAEEDVPRPRRAAMFNLQWADEIARFNINVEE